VNGRVSITLDDLYQVSEALGIPVKELLYDNLIEGETKFNSAQKEKDKTKP
jgi:hypothetical protein